MGNVPSGSNTDSEEEDNDILEEGDVNSASGQGLDSSLDLGILFDHALLRDTAAKVKEEPQQNFLQQHQSTILRWLEERRTRHEETIGLSQFADMLVSRGASREDCVELFNQFDAEGEGHIDVETFHETLQSLPGGGLGSKGDLRTAIKTLQACSISPGFVDVYADNREAVVNHGPKLLKFLMRNRAPSTSLPLPALEGFCNTSEMRLKVLQAHLEAMKEQVDMRKKAPSVEEGQVLRSLTKCYTGIEVSTNKGDVSRLTNSDTTSYWQSDGPARSHWIRMKMRPNVVVKQLSINVASADQSYMPQHVVVTAGRDDANLREISDVRIPNHFTGDYTLVENVKIPYPIIQINVRRCHSDGCDTRIRGVKAVGYRVMRSKGMSVSDASAVWYLAVLGATATAAMPFAPQLRDSILVHTRSALNHMKPLSLSSTSPDRPSFLTANVLTEMENFLHSVVSYGGSIQAENLKLLLELTLARGNIKSIFRVLKLLYETADEDFDALDLLTSLEDVSVKATKDHGLQLKMSLTSCDGGWKENSSRPENVLTDNWTTEAYLSEGGKTKVNMMFSCSSSNPVKLTKVAIKVSKGPIGPKEGLVFVVDDIKRDSKEKQTEDTDYFSSFNKYNSWTKPSYLNFLKQTKGKDLRSDEPVAYFSTEEDWDEVEVQMDRIVTGKYVLIKFLGARKENAERIGLLGIHFYGYDICSDCPVNEDLKLDEVVPVPEEGPFEGSILFLRTLAFVDNMAKDLVRIKSKPRSGMAREREGHLEMSSCTLEQIWDVYSLVTSRGTKHRKIKMASVLLLRLLYQGLPYLKASSRSLELSREDVKDAQMKLSKKVFAHLCDIVDDDGCVYDERMQRMATMVILDGAEVFFPDSGTRRSHLLSMVDKVMEEKKATSLALTFESLCRFFSNKDASGLLGLPDEVSEDGFDYSSVLSVMNTLISVAYQECHSCMTESSKHSDSPSNLVQLLCAMQKSLLTWCGGQLQNGGPEGKSASTALISEFTAILSNKVLSSLQAVHKKEKKLFSVDKLEHSYVSTATRQLVLFLNMFTGVEGICMPVLRNLQPIAAELRKFSSEVPDLFYKIDSEEWNKSQGQTVLRTWEVESLHNYENNQDISMVYSCPGCSEFLVEFDHRCETERRYDYLEFTDSNGTKRRFDQKVGTEKWPKVVHFKAGNRLVFNFHSDGSNNEWGYKFKVIAKGSPDVALSWIFDLQLGMARLFGLFCSAALNSKKSSVAATGEASEEEIKLLHSEVWTTLFRGGYMTGKLQRSLSGHHATTDIPTESSVSMFLQGVASQDEGPPQQLIKLCREKAQGPFIGGPQVDKAIASLFASLIWHSQELREQVTLFASNTPPDTLPEGILEAFKTAETLRRSLVDRRQKLVLQAEESGQEGRSTGKVEPDSPVIACQEKARFLLKFAGLQRIPDKTENRDTKRAKWLSRKSSWQRTSGEHKGFRQRTLSQEDIRVIDKHPSFKLILDFVSNDAYSHERIHGLLQQRIKHANMIADIYLFAAEFLRMSSDPDLVQAPAVLFLQQFLASQKHFPRHYADNLDGCGLNLESKVRRAYYTLVRRGLEGVKSYSAQQSCTPRFGSAAFECLRAFVLHLLDTEWKAYDHTFILDVRLPEFFLETAKATVVVPKTDINEISEQQELDQYQEGMKWFEDAKANFEIWWGRMQSGSLSDDQKRRMHLFVARFSDTLDVVITCDGCDVTLPGRRYRCLNCPDMDLCSACYLGGVKPNGHVDSHEVVDLWFKCDGCNAFIVGTRYHCNECENFDLCIGCHTFSKFPSRHSAVHRTTKFPMKTDVTTNHPSSLVQTYTHHHAWLQFAALALSLAKTVNEPDKSNLNVDYLRTAGQLHMECIDLATKCLTYTNTAKAEGDKGSKTNTQSLASISEFVATDDKSVACDGSKPTCSDETISDGRSQSSGADGQDTTDSPVPQPGAKPSSGAAAPQGENVVGTASEEVKDSTEVKLTPEVEGAVSGVGQEMAAAGGVKTTPDGEDIATGVTTQETLSQSVHDSVENVAATDTGTEFAGERKMESGEIANVEDISVTVQELTVSKEESSSSEDLINERTNSALPSRTTSVETGASASSSAEETASVEGVSDNTATNNEELEQMFAKGAQERILGLLGAILPQDSRLGHWTKCCTGIEEFIAESFLPALFKIVRNGRVDEETRSLALGILAKFLQCSNPYIADKAVKVCRHKGATKTEGERSGEETVGKDSVAFLAGLGADYLARSELDASSGIAATLQQLASSSQWQFVVAENVSGCLERLDSRPKVVDLGALFGLLVLAGFPDVVRMGSVVELKETGGDRRKVVVMKYYPDKGAVMVIDLKSRRRKTVKEYQLEAPVLWPEAFRSARFNVLLRIVKDILTRLNEGAVLPVERVWVLYLALKGMLGNLKSNSAQSFRKEMQSSGVVPLLTNLSCRGTSFSLQWLLRDLEVLSLKLYKAKKDLKETKSEKSSQSKSKPDTGTNAPTTPSTPSTPSLVSQEPQSQEGQDPLEGLDDITRACFETIHEAVQAPLPVLRAIYESVGQDRGKLLEKVQRSFDGSGFQVSDELRESAKKWERPVEKPEVVEPSLEDAAIDLGVVRYRPDDLKPKTLEAKVEDAVMVQKLIPTLSEVEIEETREKQARTKSSELLRKELDKERKPGSTDYLRKVNLALSIIYARHMMAALFSDWPEEEPITSQLLDKCDEVQLIGLLDLLQRQESKEQFEKVVAHVVRQGDTGLIQPLSLAAAHCMGEVTLSSETKESDHKYKNNSKAEGCVHIRGAATLSIKFDPRCSTEEGCDELIISTSPDYQQNRHVFSGSQGRWIDLELPGDTLYYRFTSDSSNNDWGWKFVVTGGQFGRFKTGFSVLNALLSLDNKVARTLPLKKLWGWLVFVACCQTGQQRLMATGLLLRLLLVVSGQAVDSEGTISLPVEASERPDLSRLKPLWTLYTKMLEKETATGSAPTIVPPAVRGFTELFLVVENLAQDWGMAEDLIVGFTTAESLKRSFAQAVQKVGLLGLAIGMPNKASEALIEAASRPPEEKQVEKTTPKQEKAKSRSSSHSDGDIPIVLNTLDLNEDDTTTSSDNDDTSDDEIYEDMGAW